MSSSGARAQRKSGGAGSRKSKSNGVSTNHQSASLSAEQEVSTAWRGDLRSLFLFFVASVIGLLSLLRFVVFANTTDTETGSLVLPTNLEEAQKLGKFLESYSRRYPVQVFVGHAACYLFLQTFAIPGTVFFNLLGGALYGVTLGYPLCLVYNTLGSICLYMLSKFYGHNLIIHFWRDKMEELRKRLDAHRGDLVWYMTSMRIFPFTPNWFMNVSAPHLHIPVRDFALAILMGLTPYNFLSCKAGVILGELRSKSEIMDTATTIQVRGSILSSCSELRLSSHALLFLIVSFFLQLVVIALVGFLAPKILRGRLKEQ